jgi:hypothetical protein
MKKQVWICQELFDEAKQRCAVLEAENAALKAEVASLRIHQQPQPVIALRSDIENVIRGLDGSEKIDDIVNRIMDRIAQRTGIPQTLCGKFLAF